MSCLWRRDSSCHVLKQQLGEEEEEEVGNIREREGEEEEEESFLFFVTRLRHLFSFPFTPTKSPNHFHRFKKMNGTEEEVFMDLNGLI